jgi:PLD-like domain
MLRQQAEQHTMTTKLKVYTNEDDALLFWSIPEPIAECRGFAIARRKKDPKGKKTEEFLLNRTGFENEKVTARPLEGQEAVVKPSTEWPFQRFSWTDHDANTGDTVSYRVIPVIRNTAGQLELLESHASDWSPAKTLGATTDGPFKAFFNRGFVMSQFMSRYLAERKLSLKQFKETISDKDDKTIREFLSGDLRLTLLKQLQIALDEKTEIFGALFELSDKELIDALCALGEKAHVVLANGSVTKKKEETAAEARARDENEVARKQLEDAGVDVETNNRFISPGALGHNKFLIRADKKGSPLIAWTGSTNWAPTGLCTQVNNGLLIEDSEIAQVYLDQWHRLRDAGSLFPKNLIAENSKPKQIGEDAPGTVRSAVWFTRASKGVDLDTLREEVQKAREGIRIRP